MGNADATVTPRSIIASNVIPNLMPFWRVPRPHRTTLTSTPKTIRPNFLVLFFSDVRLCLWQPIDSKDRFWASVSPARLETVILV